MAFVETTARLAGRALRRVQAEAALARAEGERAAVSGEALEAASGERGRIATRIHDEVLPHLAAATVQADNVRAAVATGEVQHAAELASKAQRAVHDGTASLREVLDHLEHEVVVPGRLREALEDLLEGLRGTENVDARLEAPRVLPEMPFAVELLVAETVRGCLENVARHAHASSVVVSLAAHDRQVAVEVRDDGCGFDAQQTHRGHGLALMAKRVEMARGHFAVRSTPEEGTTVAMAIPV